MLKGYKSKKQTSNKNNRILVSNEDNTPILLKNSYLNIKLNQKSGEIISWSAYGQEITNAAISPNFWRPPTDNDLGNGMHKWAAIWKEASNNYKASIKVPIKENTNGSISYTIQYSFPDKIAEAIANYTIKTDGAIKIDYLFTPLKDSLPNLARLGMQLKVPATFKTTKWYGKGPQETYWDRKTGAKTAIWEGAITDQFHRYARPQETGNKTDLRWFSLQSANLNIRVSSTDNQLLQGSIWPFLETELDFAIGKNGGESASGLVPVTSKHGADISIGDTYTWNIDHLQMGVGGDTSWGRRVHKEYSIPAKEYHYSFIISPTKPE